jgi:hypothetical protein
LNICRTLDTDALAANAAIAGAFLGIDVFTVGIVSLDPLVFVSLSAQP